MSKVAQCSRLTTAVMWIVLLPAAWALAGCGNVGSAPPPTPTPYRVLYDADLVLNVEAGTLTADWRLDYTFDQNPPERLAFLLNRGLRIDRVEGAIVRGHEIEQFHVPQWNLVVLQVERAPFPMESITLHVSYSGRLDLPHPTNRISADWIELNIESMWHPVFATTDREMWGGLRVKVPPGW